MSTGDRIGFFVFCFAAGCGLTLGLISSDTRAESSVQLPEKSWKLGMTTVFRFIDLETRKVCFVVGDVRFVNLTGPGISCSDLK